MDVRAGFSPPRLFSGAVVLTLVAVLSGCALAFEVDATPEGAHGSVAGMAASSLWGFVRAVHAWSATGALLLTVLAGACTYVEGRTPRMVLAAGLGVFALLLALFESGTVLAWDQRGWEAWLHVRDGAALFGFDVGGASPSTTPLAAVFWIHAVVLPLMAAGMAGWIMWRARLRFDQPAALTSAVASVAVFTAAILVRPSLGPAPIEGLFVSRPHWPFLWLVPLQDALGSRALLLLPLALLAALTLVFFTGPSLDSSSPASSLSSTGRRSLILIMAGFVALFSGVAFF